MALRDPLVEQTIAGSNINLDPNDLEEVRRWGNSIRRARDAWSDLNRNGLRYSDREAPGPVVRRATSYGAK